MGKGMERARVATRGPASAPLLAAGGGGGGGGGRGRAGLVRGLVRERRGGGRGVLPPMEES